MDYILRVNVERKEIIKEGTAEEERKMGGRGLSARILNREIDPLCHPLGAENKLIIAPGLLAGTMAPSFGRLSFGAKSPLTQGIKEANAGGTAAQKLDRLGIKAIIIEGQGQEKEFYILCLSHDKNEILPAGELRGKRNYEVASGLRQRFGEKVAVISIGPCGEMKMGAASIAVTDQDGRPCRRAGRGDGLQNA